MPKRKYSYLVLKNFSASTVSAYGCAFRQFLDWRTFKHQVFMTLIYATGLRLSEVLHLKLTGIDFDRMQLRVRKGKGAKDRYVVLPECLLELLRRYYKTYRPEGYLFNGK